MKPQSVMEKSASRRGIWPHREDRATMVGGKPMRVWGLGALVLLAIFAGGCGSNSTPVAVTVTTTVSGAGSNSLTILINTPAQFEATVTGASSNIVFWQICKTPSASNTTPPTDCTQGVGPTQCTAIPKVSSPLTGFGTITPDGLYTAPGTVPQPNQAFVVATSCVDSTDFGKFTVIIDSGIRVTITPSSPTLGSGETLQFTATVRGTANTAVTWSLCQNAAAGGLSCGAMGVGSITAGGLYQAPNGTASLIVQAISAADQNQSATTNVSVVAATPPTLTSLDPSTAAQGSAQQDVYLTGTDFFATDTVLVGGVVLPTANVTAISSTLLRVTIPAAQLAQAGTVVVGVQDQEGNPAAQANLNVVAVRPAVVGATPDNVPESSASSPTILLTGGFFSPPTVVNGNVVGTTATFNGQAVNNVTVASSRQLSLPVPAGDVGTPGLYPIVVQNSALVLGNLETFTSALNLGITPIGGAIPVSAIASSIGVGASPSAVAVDEADGIAVVANTGDGTVSLINLTTDTVIGGPIAVGNQPTGVAVDDLLPHAIALVVNSADQTVSAIDLKTQAVVGTALSVSIGPQNTSPVPLSIGVNPITHRALVAYESTNQATVLDVSTGVPVTVQQIGGGSGPFGTGANPAVAIDRRLNWAVVTPGGSGAVNLVDLGLDAVIPGLPNGRAPQVIGEVTISTTAQGIGVDSETHEAFVSDPQLGTLTTFSLLDFSVNTVFNGASEFDQKGFGAAAASALENVGIAVDGTGGAVIVDLQNSLVLQTVSGLGSSSTVQAVAVDAVTNQAVAVNHDSNSVSIVSLGTAINPPGNAINPLQIVDASPAVVFGGPGTPPTSLTINGSGFEAASTVFLDGTALATNFVSARQLVATVPAAMLIVPQNHAVQVQNPGGAFSNVTDLTVVQPVRVGNGPVGVAVDTDRDLAVVTNSTDGTVSLVALTTQTPVGPTQTAAGAIGVVGSAITVGTAPDGVAVIPRMGLALAANSGSDDATLVDVTQTYGPVNLCGATPGCAGTAPTGVAINQDSATGVITDANVTSPTSAGGVAFVRISAATSTTPPSGAFTIGSAIDHNPIAVAVDPNPLFPYAAVATDSTASSVDFLDMSSGGTLVGRISNLENPSGIVFDPVNQIFLAANSLVDEVVLMDPTDFVATPVRVGIGPTSLDYSFQTSTLVTVNSVSHTMSVLSYVCPPSQSAPACLGPQVRTVLGLGGTQATVPVFGPNAIAVDPTLNLAVLVDEDDNQVLLVPLPH